MPNLDLLPTVPGATGDIHAPTSNTAAVVTYAADASRRHVLSQITWSYSGAPTAGSLKVEDVSGTTVFGPVAITAAGPGQISFYPPLRAAAVNTALIVTLAAGGSGVSGVLTCRHWLETPSSP